jgi:hypothetical protein
MAHVRTSHSQHWSDYSKSYASAPIDIVIAHVYVLWDLRFNIFLFSSFQTSSIILAGIVQRTIILSIMGSPTFRRTVRMKKLIREYWKEKLIRSILTLYYMRKSFYGCHMWSRNCLPFWSTWVYPRFSWVRDARFLVFCVVFCISLLVPLSNDFLI